MRNKNSGFTIIEMIVTMAVLAILLTVSVTGLFSWQDWANFHRQNEYAKMLFVAAQNQLSEYDADGRLKEFQDALCDGTVEEPTTTKYHGVGFNLTAHVSGLTKEDGDSYDNGALYPESGNTNASLYQGEIVALRAHSGEYAQYLADPQGLKSSDPDAYWVFELLASYVYDISVLNGTKQADGSGNGAAICVEVAPDDGQVVSVLYSDKNDQFIYKGLADPDGTAESSGIVDIANRTESYRNERMVGFYGVDTLSKATEAAPEQPSVAMVRLYNKEDFYLACRLPEEDRAKLTTKVKYTINLHGSQQVDDKLLTIELDGTRLKTQSEATAIDCPVYQYDASRQPVSIGHLPILAWVEADDTVHVVLDAVDIQATTYLYKNELADLRSSSERIGNTQFAKTFSYFRFGVKDDNLFASVSTTGADGIPSQPIYNFGNGNASLNQEAKHATFAGEKCSLAGGKSAYTYAIKNARHLSNMRYIEDLSYGQEAGSEAAAATIAGVTFSVKDDIDWKDFQQNKHVYDSSGAVNLASLNGKLVDENGTKIALVTKDNCDFPSVSQLRDRDVLEGNGKKITGISVTEVSNVLYGLYLEKTQKGAELYTTRPSGFINVNYGMIQNLQLDGLTVSGNRFVGGFCGINAGTVTDLETLNTNKMSVIIGREHVGGIMGFQMPTSQEMEITGLTNRAKVQGVRAVGGILGMVRNSFKTDIHSESSYELPELPDESKTMLKTNPKVSITIRDCHNYGVVAGQNSSDLKEIYAPVSEGAIVAVGQTDDPDEVRFIGGIVGYIYNQDGKENGGGNTGNMQKIIIESCTGAPTFEEAELKAFTDRITDPEYQKQVLKGNYVGGIVGYNYFGEIKNCSTKPEDGTVGCVFGYRYVGGIVGANAGTAEFAGVAAGGSDDFDGTLDGGLGENHNHVVAYDYAGGILGCNAIFDEKDSKKESIILEEKTPKKYKDPDQMKGIVAPVSGGSLLMKLSNWTNHGVTVAVHGFAGGITGYNTGWIYNCNSDINAEAADKYFENLILGDYSGNIAGYNNGMLGNTIRTINKKGQLAANDKNVQKGGELVLTCYRTGQKYAGGIVGYNDVDALLEDYTVSGAAIDLPGLCEVNEGTIQDCNVFHVTVSGAAVVGSIAAQNTATGIIRDCRIDHVTVSAASEGAFIGGIVGYNAGSVLACGSLDPSKGDVKVIGVSGGAVGGIVGYNGGSGIVSGYEDDKKKEHLLSTGKNWQILLQNCTADSAVGGIIGKADGPVDLNYVVNDASVSCTAHGKLVDLQIGNRYDHVSGSMIVEEGGSGSDETVLSDDESGETSENKENK